LFHAEPGARYNALMPRRFQFSLRTLFAGTALCALGLVVWRAYPFASMQVERPRRGENIKVNGRFMRALGPPEIRCFYELENDGGGSVDFGDVTATRSFFAFYHFHTELTPIEKPGLYQLELHVFDWPGTKKLAFRVTQLVITTFDVDP
jgi:hypothetical protein